MNCCGRKKGKPQAIKIALSEFDNCGRKIKLTSGEKLELIDKFELYATED